MINLDTGSVENIATRGRLVLIGGSEDRKGPMRVLRRVLETNNAQSVAIIPTASSYPERVMAEYRRAFGKLGVPRLLFLDIRTAEQADRPEAIEQVSEADIIFFTGGDQVKLVRTFRQTALLEAIWQRFRDGVTIAGTSAGAAASGNPMIFDGDGRGFRKGFVANDAGFGFLDGITVDTHFIRRSRLPRLAQFLSIGMSRRAIGLAEDTGVIVETDGTAEVIGRDMVTLLSSDELSTSSYDECDDGAELTMDGFRLGFLAPGAVFDIHALRVVATPEERSNRRPAAGLGGST